jgi:hypothetical protein
MRCNFTVAETGSYTRVALRNTTRKKERIMRRPEHSEIAENSKDEKATVMAGEQAVAGAR